MRIEALQQALASMDDKVPHARALRHNGHEAAERLIRIYIVHACSRVHIRAEFTWVGGCVCGEGGGGGGGGRCMQQVCAHHACGTEIAEEEAKTKHGYDKTA